MGIFDFLKKEKPLKEEKPKEGGKSARRQRIKEKRKQAELKDDGRVPAGEADSGVLEGEEAVSENSEFIEDMKALASGGAEKAKEAAEKLLSLAKTEKGAKALKIGKLALSGVANLTASVIGVRAFYSLPKHFIEKAKIGKLGGAIEGINVALSESRKEEKPKKPIGAEKEKYSDQKIVSKKIEELNKILKNTKEGSERGSEQRRMIARILKDYRLGQELNKEETQVKIKEIVSEYTTAKTSGLEASSDAMRLFFVSTGGFAFALPGSALFDYLKGYAEKKKELKRAGKEASFKDLTAGVVAGGCKEFFRSLFFQGEGKTKVDKAKKGLRFLGAGGKIVKYAALTGMAVGGGDRIMEQFDRMIDNLSLKDGVAQSAENVKDNFASAFTRNIEFYKKLFTDPLSFFEKAKPEASTETQILPEEAASGRTPLRAPTTMASFPHADPYAPSAVNQELPSLPQEEIPAYKGEGKDNFSEIESGKNIFSHNQGRDLSAETQDLGAKSAPLAEEAILEKNSAALEVDVFKNIEIKRGDTVWGVVGRILENTQEFKKIEALDAETAEALKTYNIDRVKDFIVAYPEEYGLSKEADVNNLSVKELKELDWQKAFADAFKNEGIASSLSQEDVSGIISSNEDMRGVAAAAKDFGLEKSTAEALAADSGKEALSEEENYKAIGQENFHLKLAGLSNINDSGSAADVYQAATELPAEEFSQYLKKAELDFSIQPEEIKNPSGRADYEISRYFKEAEDCLGAPQGKETLGDFMSRYEATRAEAGDIINTMRATGEYEPRLDQIVESNLSVLKQVAPVGGEDRFNLLKALYNPEDKEALGKFLQSYGYAGGYENVSVSSHDGKISFSFGVEKGGKDYELELGAGKIVSYYPDGFVVTRELSENGLEESLADSVNRGYEGYYMDKFRFSPSPEEKISALDKILEEGKARKIDNIEFVKANGKPYIIFDLPNGKRGYQEVNISFLKQISSSEGNSGLEKDALAGAEGAKAEINESSGVSEASVSGETKSSSSAVNDFSPEVFHAQLVYFHEHGLRENGLQKLTEQMNINNNSLARIRATNILNGFQLQYSGYAKGDISREDFEKTVDAFDKKYPNVLDKEGLLKVKEELANTDSSAGKKSVIELAESAETETNANVKALEIFSDSGESYDNRIKAAMSVIEDGERVKLGNYDLLRQGDKIFFIIDEKGKLFELTKENLVKLDEIENITELRADRS